MTHTEYPTVEQIEALRAFAAANGRAWKSKLNLAWQTGRYSDYYATERCDLLQQVRNTFGPSWLIRFKMPDPALKMAELPADRGKATVDTLETLELTNGEWANTQSIIHFLCFMKSENSPLPVSNEELDHLLTRYVKFERREQMQFVNMLRVERGESPLPKELLA